MGRLKLDGGGEGGGGRFRVKTKNLDGEIETGRLQRQTHPVYRVKTKNLDGEIETVFLACPSPLRRLREDQESRWGD